MVGVAARVALVQVPWLILEDELSPDMTNHITGLETMLSEMQLRVRKKKETEHFLLDHEENIVHLQTGHRSDGRTGS